MIVNTNNGGGRISVALRFNWPTHLRFRPRLQTNHLDNAFSRSLAVRPFVLKKVWQRSKQILASSKNLLVACENCAQNYVCTQKFRFLHSVFNTKAQENKIQVQDCTYRHSNMISHSWLNKLRTSAVPFLADCSNKSTPVCPVFTWAFSTDSSCFEFDISANDNCNSTCSWAFLVSSNKQTKLIEHSQSYVNRNSKNRSPFFTSSRQQNSRKTTRHTHRM